MLAFLCMSSHIDTKISFNDIKEKDVVFVLGKPHPQLSKRILSEISGEKFSLAPTDGFSSFNLKTFVKGKVKIGGLSLRLNDDSKIRDFLSQHKDLYILLLDENPEKNPIIMEHLTQEQPKYVFYNSTTQGLKKHGNTHFIGLSLFAVERYSTS